MRVTAEARVVSSTSQPAVSVSILREASEPEPEPVQESKPAVVTTPKPTPRPKRKPKAGSKGVTKIKKRTTENKKQSKDTLSDSEFRNLIRGFIKD